jgi:hypothetical protein
VSTTPEAQRLVDVTLALQGVTYNAATHQYEMRLDGRVVATIVAGLPEMAYAVWQRQVFKSLASPSGRQPTR